MNIETIDISKFQRDDSFYGSLKILLTIKSFDLQAIRKRYIKSRKSKTGKVGSVERREVGIGGIVKVEIEHGKVVESEIIAKMNEPRGISQYGSLLGIAAENIVYLITDQGIKKITSPWFSYIHTIDFSPETGDKVLVSSSGLDCIFEFDVNTLEQTYAWYAWDNGFNEATDPKTKKTLILTRDEQAHEQFCREGKESLLINDPLNQVLPTAMRAAFINSVVYHRDEPGNILGTFFHEGAVYQIDKLNNQAICVLPELKNPHGGRSLHGEFLATSTGSGEVVTGTTDKQVRYSYKNLPGKPGELSDLEWLQNSTVLGKNIITVDSNRTSFVIINPEQKLYSLIAYDRDWAVQDLIVADITEAQTGLLGSLSI